MNGLMRMSIRELHKWYGLCRSRSSSSSSSRRIVRCCYLGGAMSLAISCIVLPWILLRTDPKLISRLAEILVTGTNHGQGAEEQSRVQNKNRAR
jgi:hypothetical protein